MKGKLGKFGFILLALALCLSITGAAFAKWSDTVTVEGTVNTGSVCVGVLDTGTSDSGIDPRVDPISLEPVTGDKDVASTISTNNSIKCEDGVTYYQSITETIANAYPYYAPTMNALLKNCGSIPVKIEDISVTSFDDPDDILSSITWKWELTYNDIVVASGEGLSALAKIVDNYQIEPGDYLDAHITAIFLESTPQGASGSLTMTITASQWNEVS